VPPLSRLHTFVRAPKPAVAEPVVSCWLRPARSGATGPHYRWPLTAAEQQLLVEPHLTNETGFPEASTERANASMRAPPPTGCAWRTPMICSQARGSHRPPSVNHYCDPWKNCCRSRCGAVQRPLSQARRLVPAPHNATPLAARHAAVLPFLAESQGDAWGWRMLFSSCSCRFTLSLP
jgi:hypothetical protein